MKHIIIFFFTLAFLGNGMAEDQSFRDFYVIPNTKAIVNVDYYTSKLVVDIGTSSSRQSYWDRYTGSATDVIFLNDGSVWKTKEIVSMNYDCRQLKGKDLIVLRLSPNKKYPFYLENLTTGYRYKAKIWPKGWKEENLQFMIKDIGVSEIVLYDSKTKTDSTWSVSDIETLQNWNVGERVVIASDMCSMEEIPKYLLVNTSQSEDKTPPEFVEAAPF